MLFSKGLNDTGSIEDLIGLLKQRNASVNLDDSEGLSFRSTGDICLISRALSTDCIGMAITYTTFPRTLGRRVCNELKKANQKLAAIRKRATLQKRFEDLPQDSFCSGVSLIEQYLWNEARRLTLLKYASDRNFDSFLGYLRKLEDDAFRSRMRALKLEIGRYFGSHEVTGHQSVRKHLTSETLVEKTAPTPWALHQET